MPKYRSGDRCVEVDQLPSIRSSAEISVCLHLTPAPVSCPPASPARHIPLPGSPLHSLCPASRPAQAPGSRLPVHPPARFPSPFPLPSLTPSPSSRFPATSPDPGPSLPAITLQINYLPTLLATSCLSVLLLGSLT
ncbi:vegetative cell wall protein gp1-like isoform X2 [Thunnus albacares]|uniref:vegetative cell wall protein gp1-like isoform X2 n=1 Tax=Thunnus albacares TaxID=8236 RepID=UPI001CF6911B|nr:vegetative cell wall protein gp1-like isoform X2 [Thunnus albacares]